MISIHTTLAGGDPPKKGEFYLWLYFNPHHPRGWRHFGRNGHRLYRWISIHTTLAGGGYFCDEFHLLLREISIHTTLAGGGYFCDEFHLLLREISIHTTLAGGDNH